MGSLTGMSKSAFATDIRNGGLTRGYRAASGGYDELVDSLGMIKPHWQPLLQALEALDPATRVLRMDQLNARVWETGSRTISSRTQPARHNRGELTSSH